MNLLKEIENYKSYDENEAIDIESFRQCLKYFGDDFYYRENLIAHLTTIVWVVNPLKTKILMGYHNIYKTLTWFGGHADGDFDLLYNTKRELEEESGISNIKVLNEGKIFDFAILPMRRHIKNEKIVSDHLHYCPTYLFEVSEDEKFRIKEDENSSIKWVDIDNLMNEVDDIASAELLYKRLIEKTKAL